MQSPAAHLCTTASHLKWLAPSVSWSSRARVLSAVQQEVAPSTSVLLDVIDSVSLSAPSQPETDSDNAASSSSDSDSAPPPRKQRKKEEHKE